MVNAPAARQTGKKKSNESTRVLGRVWARGLLGTMVRNRTLLGSRVRLA
jgi:hypothetical protein